jgi:hypothetical protein
MSEQKSFFAESARPAKPKEKFLGFGGESGKILPAEIRFAGAFSQAENVAKMSHLGLGQAIFGRKMWHLGHKGGNLAKISIG